jgi:FkbM family methyltransferase
VSFVDVSRRVRHLHGLQRQRWLWAIVRFPYRALLRGLSRARGISRPIDGDTYRWRYPFSEFDAEFEAPVLRAFREVTTPGAVVFDIGANFGLFTIYGARLVGSRGRVFAFEPSRAADALADHARLNGVEDRVEILRMMVGASIGEAAFWEAPDTTFSSISEAAAARGAGGNGGPQRRLRPMTTIDAFCEEHQVVPDVIKIDIEGAEGNALRGAAGFLARRRGHLVLELHPSVLRELGEDVGDLLAELDRQGWRPKRVFARGDEADPASTVHYVCSAVPE